MVAQISSKLASAKLNIQSLLNKSRDSIAYTLVDVDGMVEESLLVDIRGIAGVIQARQIVAV
jgi:D-3-phosphoglycerate dehydrogenase